MIIPGYIDNWFCNDQSCDGVAGVFEESVREDRDAEGKGEEDF